MTSDDAINVFTSATTATLLTYQAAGRTLAAEVRRLRPIEDAYVCLEDDVCMVAGGQPLHPDEDHDKNLLVIVDTLTALRARLATAEAVLARLNGMRCESCRWLTVLGPEEGIEYRWCGGIEDGPAIHLNNAVTGCSAWEASDG